MKRVHHSLFCLLAGSLALSPGHVAANPTAKTNIKLYGASKVEATGIRQFRGKKVALRDFSGGKLNVIIDPEKGGVASVDATPKLAEEMSLIFEEGRKLSPLLAAKNFKEALPLLRKAVYPLLRFAGLPEEFGQVHQPIESLLEGLIETGNLDEAVYLVRTYPAVVKQAILRPRILDLLDRLRADGKYEDILPAYEKLSTQASEPDLQALAKMWTIYCDGQLGDLEKAKAGLSRLQVPEAGTGSFYLYQFVRGFLQYKQDKFAEALDSMSRGLVYAKPTESWIPEATYYIAECYRQTEKFDAALGAYQEIFKLNGESNWGRQASEAHKGLSEWIKREKEKKDARAKAAAKS